MGGRIPRVGEEGTMGLLARLGALFGGTGRASPADDAVHAYIRCDHCGATVHLRLSKQHELVPDYEAGGYFVRKEVVDSKCFRHMHAEIRYDATYRVTGQAVTGGRFITEAEHEAASGKEG
jgi:hypothetical protein